MRRCLPDCSGSAFHSSACGNRYLLRDPDAEAFQAGNTLRMIGEQPDRPDIQIRKNLRANADFSLRLSLMRRARRLGGFAMEHKTLTIIHAETFRSLVKINESADSFLRNHLQRTVEDSLAIAQCAAKHITGQAVGMHPDQHGLCSFL